jgi:hypothetical protein
MVRIPSVAVLVALLSMLVPAAAQASNEAAPWSAPDYLSPPNETAEGPSLGLLSDGSLVATWSEDTADGWFPELASEPFATGAWSTPDPISSTAISQPLDPIGGARTAFAGDGRFVSAWLASSTPGYEDVDGASGSVKPGDPPSASPHTFAAYDSAGAYLYGAISPQVVMSSDGTGTVEYTVASKTPSGGTFVGLTAINGGEPAATTQGESANYEYNPGPYSSTDYTAFDPALGGAPLNADWDASLSDQEVLVSPDNGDFAQVYATADTSDWDGVTPATPSGLPGLDAAAAVLPDGRLLVASGYDGLYTWETGQASATAVPGASDADSRPAIAAFNDGSATIAYTAPDPTTGDTVVEEVSVAPDGTLSDPTELSPNTMNAGNVTDAYGPDGTTYVVWTEADPAGTSATDNGIYTSIRLPGGSFPTTPQAVYTAAYVNPGLPKIEIDQTGFATVVAEVFEPDESDRIAAFTHANPLPPRDLTLPTIRLAGSSLSCAHGTWANQPTVYRYEWLRNGSPIGGATAQTYTVTTSDAGTQLSCRVTATNGYGSGIATSAVLKVSAVKPSPVTPGKITNSNGTVTVTISCSGSSTCQSVTISLSVVEELTGNKLTGVIAKARKQKRTVVIAKVTITLKPGQHKTVKLTLNSKGKALLRSRHKLPTKLTFVSGKSTLKSKKLTLAAKKSKSHKKK